MSSPPRGAPAEGPPALHHPQPDEPSAAAATAAAEAQAPPAAPARQHAIQSSAALQVVFIPTPPTPASTPSPAEAPSSPAVSDGSSALTSSSAVVGDSAASPERPLGRPGAAPRVSVVSFGARADESSDWSGAALLERGTPLDAVSPSMASLDAAAAAAPADADAETVDAGADHAAHLPPAPAPSSSPARPDATTSPARAQLRSVRFTQAAIDEGNALDDRAPRMARPSVRSLDASLSQVDSSAVGLSTLDETQLFATFGSVVEVLPSQADRLRAARASAALYESLESSTAPRAFGRVGHLLPRRPRVPCPLCRNVTSAICCTDCFQETVELGQEPIAAAQEKLEALRKQVAEHFEVVEKTLDARAQLERLRSTNIVLERRAAALRTQVDSDERMRAEVQVSVRSRTANLARAAASLDRAQRRLTRADDHLQPHDSLRSVRESFDRPISVPLLASSSLTTDGAASASLASSARPAGNGRETPPELQMRFPSPPPRTPADALPPPTAEGAAAHQFPKLPSPPDEAGAGEPLPRFASSARRALDVAGGDERAPTDGADARGADPDVAAVLAFPREPEPASPAALDRLERQLSRSSLEINAIAAFMQATSPARGTPPLLLSDLGAAARPTASDSPGQLPAAAAAAAPSASAQSAVSPPSSVAQADLAALVDELVELALHSPAELRARLPPLDLNALMAIRRELQRTISLNRAELIEEVLRLFPFSRDRLTVNSFRVIGLRIPIGYSLFHVPAPVAISVLASVAFLSSLLASYMGLSLPFPSVFGHHDGEVFHESAESQLHRFPFSLYRPSERGFGQDVVRWHAYVHANVAFLAERHGLPPMRQLPQQFFENVVNFFSHVEARAKARAPDHEVAASRTSQHPGRRRIGSKHSSERGTAPTDLLAGAEGGGDGRDDGDDDDDDAEWEAVDEMHVGATDAEALRDLANSFSWLYAEKDLLPFFKGM